DITLSSAVRNNLLSLQGTAKLLGKTQERLATGLKVNSALDDPNAFFTASSLNSRGSDLNRLLDSVGLAVQTIKAADEGIASITTLVESAQATARQALQAPAGSATPTTLTGTTTITADTAAVATGTVTGLAGGDFLAGLGYADGETITLTTESGGTTTYTIGTAATTTIATLVTALDANTGAGVALTGGQLVVTAANNTNTITVGGTGDSAAGFGIATTAYNPTNAQIAGFTGTLSVATNGGTAQTIDLSTINNRAGLEAALAGLTNVTGSVTGNAVTLVAASADDSVTISGGTEVGLTDATTAAPRNAQRTALEAQFNSLRTQIDQLSADASFNGNNLLQGDNLTVIFNEDGSSSLGVTGVTFNSTGLGIAAAAADDFQNDTTINTTLGSLDTAISTLRTQASTFGSNLSVVEVRQDFTKNLINTLETGAANLTLADTNLEGANLLALQTRQQLSSTALSLASQADQNVLRLIS
ncbi:MAG: hypothetical protein K8F25_03780, partial [Fimbriimonadaceae bacterium]|nr:hypothetical protein [Alphaproteobacteria bacterium]